MAWKYCHDCDAPIEAPYSEGKFTIEELVQYAMDAYAETPPCPHCGGNDVYNREDFIEALGMVLQEIQENQNRIVKILTKHIKGSE